MVMRSTKAQLCGQQTNTNSSRQADLRGRPIGLSIVNDIKHLNTESKMNLVRECLLASVKARKVISIERKKRDEN